MRSYSAIGALATLMLSGTAVTSYATPQKPGCEIVARRSTGAVAREVCLQDTDHDGIEDLERTLMYTSTGKVRKQIDYDLRNGTTTVREWEFDDRDMVYKSILDKNNDGEPESLCHWKRDYFTLTVTRKCGSPDTTWPAQEWTWEYADVEMRTVIRKIRRNKGEKIRVWTPKKGWKTGEAETLLTSARE